MSLHDEAHNVNKVVGADLVLPGRVTRRVKVLGLYKHGVYLNPNSVPANVINGLNVQIGLCIPPNNLDGYTRVKGIIYWHSKQIEVRFSNPPSQFVKMLLEYLKEQNIQHELAATAARQQLIRQQYINSISQNAVGTDLAQLLANLFNTMVTGLEKRGERAGSDFERREALDDAACLRRVCLQDALLQNLAGNWLKLQPIVPPNANPDLPAIISSEQTSLWLIRREVVDRMEQQLAISLQQVKFALEELQAGNVHPPCAPTILVTSLEQTLADLNLSANGVVYGLRCAGDFIQPFMQFYHKLLNAWKQLK